MTILWLHVRLNSIAHEEAGNLQALAYDCMCLGGGFWTTRQVNPWEQPTERPSTSLSLHSLLSWWSHSALFSLGHDIILRLVLYNFGV